MTGTVNADGHGFTVEWEGEILEFPGVATIRFLGTSTPDAYSASLDMTVPAGRAVYSPSYRGTATRI